VKKDATASLKIGLSIAGGERENLVGWFDAVVCQLRNADGRSHCAKSLARDGSDNIKIAFG
jgi:hypothetical protein